MPKRPVMNLSRKPGNKSWVPNEKKWVFFNEFLTGKKRGWFLPLPQDRMLGRERQPRAYVGPCWGPGQAAWGSLPCFAQQQWQGLLLHYSGRETSAPELFAENAEHFHPQSSVISVRLSKTVLLKTFRSQIHIWPLKNDPKPLRVFVSVSCIYPWSPHEKVTLSKT